MSRLADVMPAQVIASPWGNTIRDRTVTPFLNAAERDAQWPSPPVGAMCYLQTEELLQVWVNNQWRRIDVASGALNFPFIFIGSGIVYTDMVTMARYSRVSVNTALFEWRLDVPAGGSWDAGGATVWGLQLPSGITVGPCHQIMTCMVGAPLPAPFGPANTMGYALCHSGDNHVSPFSLGVGFDTTEMNGVTDGGGSVAPWPHHWHQYGGSLTVTGVIEVTGLL
jgi:hypothetical protein